MQIAIVGAGVIGLSCAVKIAEYFREHKISANVHLFSDELSPKTTGDGSAGLWGPFLLGDTPTDKIIKWSKETHDLFHALWQKGLASEAGICLLPVTRLTTELNVGDKFTFWRDIVFGCNDLNERQLDIYRQEHGKNYTSAINFVTFTCEPIHFLPYLMKRFRLAGGKFSMRKIIDFNELAEFDVIVNCTGLGARQLADDRLVRPIRGQVSRLDASWIFECFLDESDDGHYVIPNSESIVLGGTHQEDDYNRNVSKTDLTFILDGCTDKIPSLRHGKVIKNWVGLRPGRSSVRIELDSFCAATGKFMKIIHNYGHGGSGVTLCWGCATDVVDLIKTVINKSKL